MKPKRLKIWLVAMVLTALVLTVAVPSFIRARKRAQASTILQELRQIDAARDQYALEHDAQWRKEGRDYFHITPGWNDLTPFLKPGSHLAMSGGKDSLGNPIELEPYSERLLPSIKTVDALADATGGDRFWGCCGDPGCDVTPEKLAEKRRKAQAAASTNKVPH